MSRIGIVYPRANLDTVPSLIGAAEAFADSGYDVDLFTYSQAGQPSPRFNSPRIHVRSLGSLGLAEQSTARLRGAVKRAAWLPGVARAPLLRGYQVLGAGLERGSRIAARARGAALATTEPFVFYQGCYLLSCDGVKHFSSQNVRCPHCLEQHHKNGTVTYSHQMFAGALVHLDLKEVIPVMPEPIIKPDGATKNDCERNAAKRFMAKFREDHPHLDVIVVEDGLSSNGPHIEDLQHYRMHFILGAKPGDHTALFTRMVWISKGDLPV